MEIEPNYVDIRCVGIRKSGEPCYGLLMVAIMAMGKIRCHRCGTTNNIYIISQKHELSLDIQQHELSLDIQPRSKYNKDKVNI